MKSLQNIPAILLAVLLAACLFTYFSTGDFVRPGAEPLVAAAEQTLVDTSQLQTAMRLAGFAATPGEQSQAREAWRLADHELDLTFAAALRQAAAEAGAALPANSRLRPLADRVAKLKQRVDADKSQLEKLGKDDEDARDLAQAQLDLDQDELDDAQEDLVREGGDKHAKLQRLLQEHEASDKVADQTLKFGVQNPAGTMVQQVREWFFLRDYDRELQGAERAASAHAAALLNEHNAIEGQVPKQPEPGASVARLRQLARLHQALTGLDQRVQDSKSLAGVYQRWSAVVESRRRMVLHWMLGSVAGILGILLGAVLLNGAVRRGFRGADRRRVHQVRVIGRTALQVVAVLLILLILFGPPTQLSTLIGLVTAGLAVVMKDFIVAFFGWFTLLGKNGIRVGDWVEIEGVSGEVIEIGVLKTVLLELGNWTEKGHPTGRRVAFSNSFAMENHYFNFSTAGQWLWDELQVLLPAGGDPYKMAEEIRKIVERETEPDASQAAEDWKRVTHQYGAREFSAGPAVSLRPGVNGLEVVVRYITRAPQRNVVKSKLFQQIVDLLHRAA